MTGAYFACSIPMYYLYTGGFTVAGFNFLYCYLAAVAFVFIAFGYFLVIPDVDRMVKVLKYIGILCVPYLLTIICSLVVWTLNLTGLRVMIRGFFWPSYQMLAIFMAGAAVYCFGEEGIYYQLTALFAAYALFFLELIKEGGAGQVLYEYWRLIATAAKETGPLMTKLERIAYAHGMGIFFLYLVFTLKENKKSRFFLLPAGLLFLSGFKRSGILGMAVGLGLILIAGRFNQAGKKAFAIFVGIAMVAGGILYIWLLSYNIVDILAERFGINTMGRSEIYGVMRQYYDFSVTFWGRGLGYVSYSISKGLIKVGGSGRGDIHNDILRQYIELGMFGFVLWLWSFFHWRIKMFMEQVDIQCGIFALVALGYCYTCYMTENMYYRFNAGLALAVVILSYALQREEKKERMAYE